MNLTLKTQKNLLFSILLTSLCFSYFVAANNYPFYSTGEPREAVVAQTMIINDSLLDSVRYGTELATKPPLTHWLMVAAASVTGEMNEFAARFPSVLAASIIVFIWSFFLISRIGNLKTIFSILILLSSFEWLRHASIARVDMVLSVNILAALLLLYLWYEKQQLRYLYFSIIPFALAALTKGPVGIALPMLAMTVFLFFEKKLSLNTLFKLFLASLVSVAPLFYWYYLESLHTGNQTIQIAILENVQRLLGNMGSDKAHTHGLLYMPGAMIAGLLPWSLFLIFIFKYTSEIKYFFTDYKNQSTLIKFCLITTIVFFVFFLIPSSKRGVYLLPIYPMATLLLSLYISDLHARFRKTKYLGSGICIAMFMLLLLIIFLAIADLSMLPVKEKISLKINFYQHIFLEAFKHSRLGLILILSVLALMIVILFKQHNNKNYKFYLAAYLLLYIVSLKIFFLAPYANAVSPKLFVANEIKDHQPETLSLYSQRMYGVLFYARMANPNLTVQDWNKKAKNVFAWHGKDAKLTKKLYVHLSETAIEKPNRHLEYVISK